MGLWVVGKPHLPWSFSGFSPPLVLVAAWRPTLQQPGATVSKAPSVIPFSKTKVCLFVNRPADLNALHLRQKSTVSTWDQLIPSRDWWPPWKPWVSSQGGPEGQERSGLANQPYVTGSKLVSGEQGQLQSWERSLGSVPTGSLPLV